MSPKVSDRLFMVFSILAILLSACSSSRGNSSDPNNPLIGKWAHIEPTVGVTVTLEFTQNKLLFTAEGLESGPAASYTYVNETLIMVKNPDTGKDVATPYTITGDTLTITFSGEGKAIFTRVK